MTLPSNRTGAVGVIVLLLVFFCLCNSCNPFWFPSSFTTTTLTLNNLFGNCYTTRSGSAVITYKGTVQMYWLKSNGKDRMDGDIYPFTSGTNPANPVVLTVKIPNDGSEYQFEVVAQGTQCSLCAFTQYGPDNCIQSQNLITHVTTAAKPQLDIQSRVLKNGTAPLSATSGQAAQSANVPGSCGCLVPD